VNRPIPTNNGRERAPNPRQALAFAVCASLALTFSFLAAAKTKDPTSTGIHGHVTDTDKNPMPGVHVKAMNEKTKAAITTDTNDRGEFALPRVPSGIYDVTFQKDGFEFLLYPHVRVVKRQPIALDVTIHRTNGVPPLKQSN
jgi:hypothetical protein